jgi:hypothetical protein
MRRRHDWVVPLLYSTRPKANHITLDRPRSVCTIVNRWGTPNRLMLHIRYHTPLQLRRLTIRSCTESFVEIAPALALGPPGAGAGMTSTCSEDTGPPGAVLFCLSHDTPMFVFFHSLPFCRQCPVVSRRGTTAMYFT